MSDTSNNEICRMDAVTLRENVLPTALTGAMHLSTLKCVRSLAVR